MTESVFSCYTCGFEEPFVFNSTSPNSGMQHASSSRRAIHDGSGLTRSRSAEALGTQEQAELGEDEDEGILDNGGKAAEEEEFHDAVQSPGSTKRIHRRAISDPFDPQLSDLQIEEEMREAEKVAIYEEESIRGLVVNTTDSAYPTLPRYPVAATLNKNCWSEPPINIYSVRGVSYLKDKKKIPSTDYLMRTRGCDLFLFEGNLDVATRSSQIMGGQLRSLPTLGINFQFPWGSMILYFEIPDKLSKFVGAKNVDVKKEATIKTSAERVMANWLQGDTDYRNERLKLIPYVAEGPWVVRNMVTGRPAIIGKKLPVSYKSYPGDVANHLAPLLMCTLDIGSSSATAKRIVSVCRRYMSALTVDIGFVIEGSTQDELPEQMLGAIRVHGPDPLKACRL